MKNIVYFIALAISTAAFSAQPTPTIAQTPAAANEVVHNASACPDLTGKYLIQQLDQPDFNATIVSTKNAAGINTLSMDVGDGASIVTLNGIALSLGSGSDYVASCYAQIIYIYVHEKKETTQTITYSLDADKNLILVDNLKGDIINAKGIRQAQ